MERAAGSAHSLLARQPDGHDGAHPLARGDRDRAAVGVDDPLDHAHPQTGAGHGMAGRVRGPEEALEQVRLLTNLETTSDKLLQIVLSGQPELEEKLRMQSLRQLRQRVALWCRTRPLNPDETHEYVAERLRIAGCKEAVFSPEALVLIHELSKGIPRLINLICETAMVEAVVERVKPIPAWIVESVASDFELSDQPILFTHRGRHASPDDPWTEGDHDRLTNLAHLQEEQNK